MRNAEWEMIRQNQHSTLSIPHSALLQQRPGVMERVIAMEITLNGKLREVADAITITQLLDELKLHPLRVAVQVNLDIIKRDRYEAATLQPGDTVEVLTFMAGG